MELHILDPQYAGDPEAVAMLQAFYSRSSESVASRLTKLGTNLFAVKQALHRYFIGYGHQSIGDCGTITVFIEGVSILAAKALQENPLYNGQECSTRYIELDGNVYQGNAAAHWWLKEYKNVLTNVLQGVRTEHPFEGFDGFDVNNPAHTKPGSQYATWQNATAARAFDVARGWIPADTKTNLSWTTTLRKVNEITTILSAHPLIEVRKMAQALREKLHSVYPHGVSTYVEKDQATADWLENGGTEIWYLDDAKDLHLESNFDTSFVTFDDTYVDFINNRPRHSDLPTWMDGLGQFQLEGLIDYGTWRDLQRHRRNLGRPPALKANDFHPWYFEQVRRYVPDMAASDIIAATQLQIDKQQAKEAKDGWHPDHQYDCPLGTVVPYCYKMGLAQAIYLAELRSGNTVHPILRPIAQNMANELTSLGFRIDFDAQPARFDLKRGTQTIYAKE